ncbi:MAG TPA: beta-ketoacyl synthase N-terminal-like domain-containing protein, partial [Acidimicrobiales bacterium]|nr:beta-ketoacyl synthase N-terminal-like domain-containing protein [Acidimicrobiales bacterium]
MGTDRRIAVLGAGMHPWGKWGRNFVEYGLAAAADALADAGMSWSDIQFVSGADTIRNGYPGFIAGATFAQALGWTGARVSSCYAACASGASALSIARAQILAGLCDVALVIGADTTPKGFFAPVGGDRKDDPDWLRFHLMGATNPTYFALYARRRMALYGDTEVDFANVKVKNSRHGLNNPKARYRKEVTVEEILESPMVADP